MSWDPYAALGLGRSATADDIRRSYRRLAKELHPDVRPGDKHSEERFKRATAAFNLLSDPVTRARFDRGEIDADGNERVFSPRAHARQGARATYGAGSMGPEPPFDIGDIFSDLFGAGSGGGPRGYRVRGRDIRFTLDIEFFDSIKGARRRVTLPEGRTLEVAIPAGVESGQVLRLKGQGGPGVQGGMPGDALVELRVRPHPWLRREGQDVLMDLNISLAEAIDGARIQVPTPNGPVALTVPAHSNSGVTLRLRGRGVGGVGDQLVRLQVMVPESQDDELARFVRKWSRRDWKPPRPHD